MGKTDDMIKDPMGNPDPTKGHLWPTVAGFTEYIKLFKSNPDDILVAAIAGPVADAQGNSLYRVKGEANTSAGGEIDPVVDHSCVQTTSDPNMQEYADPAVRIQQWVTNLNGIFYPICQDNFKAAMLGIAMKINQKLGASCVSTHIASDPMDPSKHFCKVSQKITSNGTVNTVNLPECDNGNGNAPCFQLVANAMQCTDPNARTLFKVCNDATCMMVKTSTDSKDANIACAVD
jgi:hypothetical protein